MPEIDDVKLYLRVDGNDEDATISALIGAAKQFLAGAGVKEQPDNPLWMLCRNALCLHYYEDRGGTRQLSSTLQSMIVQLQYAPEVVTDGSG